MKKLMVLCITAILSVSLFGCTGDNKDDVADKTATIDVSATSAPKNTALQDKDKTNPYQVLNIIDSSADCDDALELIYEDENYEYYFPCIKSEWVEVTYTDGTKENVVVALREKHISINDLTTFNISFIKQEKN